jgi:TPR repeat protein
MGVEVNLELAFKYYQLAADMGESTSMYNLGYSYERGLNSDIDYEKVI